MKKLIYITLLFAAVAMVGCKGGGVKTDTIVGKWDITNVEINLNNMPEGTEEMIPMMKKAIMQSKYEFKADNSYTFTSMFSGEGKWSYDKSKNAIVLDNADPKAEDNTLEIKESSADKMVVLNDKGEEGSITLTLERAKETKEEETPSE